MRENLLLFVSYMGRYISIRVSIIVFCMNTKCIKRLLVLGEQKCLRLLMVIFCVSLVSFFCECYE